MIVGLIGYDSIRKHLAACGYYTAEIREKYYLRIADAYIDIKEQRGQYWLENIMKDRFAVSIVLVKTEYTIDKVNLTNAYCKYVKKFISCASVCELIFLLLILLAVSCNNFTAAIICCILFVLVIIIQIIVFKKEFMRLKKIGDVL